MNPPTDFPAGVSPAARRIRSIRATKLGIAELALAVIAISRGAQRADDEQGSRAETASQQNLTLTSPGQSDGKSKDGDGQANAEAHGSQYGDEHAQSRVSSSGDRLRDGIDPDGVRLDRCHRSIAVRRGRLFVRGRPRRAGRF